MLGAYQVLLIYLVLLKGLGEAMFWTDYEYIKDVGWLRLHMVPATWWDARLRCNIAGDILASPTTSAISTLMKTTMSDHKLAQESVFVDIYAFLPEGDFESIDGTPLSNISLKWADGEPNNLNNEEDCMAMTTAGKLADISCESVLPYFCLKEQSIRLGCDTTSKKYKLDPRTGSCYRFNHRSQPWPVAEMVCASENAHLAVINSAVEAQVLKELYAQNPKDTINGGYPDKAHLGYWDWNEKSQWVDIFGKTLAKKSYEKWGPGQPSKPGVENCGSMTRSGVLNNVVCSTWHPFICECAANI